MNNIRKACVAGQFYSNNKKALIHELDQCFLNINKTDNSKINGMIVPHAGYVYSGHVAASAYSFLDPDMYNNPIFIMLGPNHTGRGNPISISDVDYWETPLGKIPVAKEFIDKLRAVDHFTVENTAHKFEHSLEVQLPFLQYIFKEKPFSILPICLSIYDINTINYFATNLKTIINNTDRDIIFIISSDFSHFLSPEECKKIDMKAIEFILKHDISKLYDYFIQYSPSICGISPILSYLTLMEDKKITAELIKYATSGDIMPMKEVVAYASIIFK